MGQENDKKEKTLRELRDEQGHFSIGILINWWLIPGFIGLLGTLAIGKMLPMIFLSVSHGRSIASTFSHLQYDLGKEFDLLRELRFEDTNLWVFLLFGFILGVFIKYAYSD